MNDKYCELLDIVKTLSMRHGLRFYEHRYCVEGDWQVDFIFYPEICHLGGNNVKYHYNVYDLIESKNVKELALTIINKALEEIGK